MSDFGDVEFFDNLEEMSSGGLPLAPDGEHNLMAVNIVIIMNGITFGLPMKKTKELVRRYLPGLLKLLDLKSIQKIMATLLVKNWC